jgi:hypothetical protein
MNDFEYYIKNDSVIKGTWINKENHIKYAIWLGNKLEYTKMEDWYKITVNLITKNYGSGLIRKYNNSPSQLVKRIFPDYDWKEWLFGQTKNGFWNDINNHIKYSIWLGNELGYKKIEDWYQITSKLIRNNNGRGLMNKYNDSVSQFLKTVFPDYEWIEWLFCQTSQRFWNDIKNHKRYAKWLGDKLGYTNQMDWYNITAKLIQINYGHGIIHKYNDSPYLFVKTIFPEYEWKEWLFDVVSNNFWNNINNQLKYVEWLGKELGYKKHEDWYKITQKLIYDNNGGGLLQNKYNNSPSQFVKMIFSDYDWKEWLFGQTKNGFWNDINNHINYATWLGNRLGYKKMKDWYQISAYLIHKNYGGGLLGRKYNDSPYLFVKTMFPKYEWKISKFPKKYSIGQIEWLEYIKVSTPDIIHILNNDNKEFKIPKTRYRADGYSINENCIYEYHGDFYHGNPKIFVSTNINAITKKTFGELYQNTIIKQKICEENGYKYISIWESEWIRAKKSVILLQRNWGKNIL